MNETRSKTTSARVEFKRKFTLLEMYRSVIYTPRAMSKLIGNKKSKLVDPHFIERLQLAVTEVNGCALCSYGHTKMALNQGMTNEEISSFLSGEDTFIKPEEAKAILFAQHYADSKGYPTKYTYDAIVKEYGDQKTPIILSAIQMILAGNMYGIPLSAFQSRLKGLPYKDSTVFYELKMEIIGLLFMPIAILHGVIRACIGLPNIRLNKTAKENIL